MGDDDNHGSMPVGMVRGWNSTVIGEFSVGWGQLIQPVIARPETRAWSVPPVNLEGGALETLGETCNRDPTRTRSDQVHCDPTADSRIRDCP